MDESARGISSTIDRLDGNLKQALADEDQAAVLVGQIIEDSCHVSVIFPESKPVEQVAEVNRNRATARSCAECQQASGSAQTAAKRRPDRG